jgi:endonuclease YncB( thermonuclease family)
MPCLAIDGDTLVCDGRTYRLVGADTPELSAPACARERALAYFAKLRVEKLLSAGAFIVHVPCRDGQFDRYGRSCGLLITPEGADAADLLIGEGLASPIWPKASGFKKKDWCHERNH